MQCLRFRIWSPICCSPGVLRRISKCRVWKMEIYPATSLNTKHCVYNTISFSKITDITNTVTEMPNTVFGKWTCRPVTFVDFFTVICHLCSTPGPPRKYGGFSKQFKWIPGYITCAILIYMDFISRYRYFKVWAYMPPSPGSKYHSRPRVL